MTGPRPPHRWAWRAGFAVVVLAALTALLAGPYRPVLANLVFGNVTGSAAEPARLAPCLPGEAVEIMDSPHISQTRADTVEYNSQPPTSGPHFAFTVATGVYQRPVAAGLFVHAMEHGHVIIHYAPGTPDDEVTALTKLAKRYGADVMLHPYPPLERGIALAAWGRLDRLDQYDEDRLVAFIEALRGRYQHGWTTDQEC